MLSVARPLTKAHMGKLMNRVRKTLRLKNTPEKTIELPPISAAAVRDGYLSVVVIAKDEATYLTEWIEFHQLVGVEHIYLYDNGSIDDTRAILAPYERSGLVTYLPWTCFDSNVAPQRQAYAHALCNFGSLWRWMAFIDIDEFIFPLRDDRLQNALRVYEDLPALALHWHMFGTSGHKTRPRGLVIENYTSRASFPPRVDSDLCKWKSIVDPTKVKAVISPHIFMLTDGRKGAFDEDRRWIQKGQRAQAASRILRLNHYFTRSEEELAVKIAKGDVSRSPADILHPREWLAAFVRNKADLANSINAETVTDESIMRFAEPLRRRLASPGRESDNRQGDQPDPDQVAVHTARLL
jgi:hypothetical protein